MDGNMMDNKLKIEYVDIKSIKMYSNNAKLHPKEQIEQIKKSMQEFGNIDPVGIWHNEIVEGHGRYQAAKSLGYETIPVIRLDSLTDEQRRAYSLIHNQLTMNTGFDLEVLQIELDSINTIDMGVFDFDLSLNGDYEEEFNIDDIEEIDGYNANEDNREYFEKTFTFPIAKKQQIINYLKKHYDEIIKYIIDQAEG